MRIQRWLLPVLQYHAQNISDTGNTTSIISSNITSTITSGPMLAPRSEALMMSQGKNDMGKFDTHGQNRLLYHIVWHTALFAGDKYYVSTLPQDVSSRFDKDDDILLLRGGMIAAETAKALAKYNIELDHHWDPVAFWKKSSMAANYAAANVMARLMFLKDSMGLGHRDSDDVKHILAVQIKRSDPNNGNLVDDRKHRLEKHLNQDSVFALKDSDQMPTDSFLALALREGICTADSYLCGSSEEARTQMNQLLQVALVEDVFSDHCPMLLTLKLLQRGKGNLLDGTTESFQKMVDDEDIRHSGKWRKMADQRLSEVAEEQKIEFRASTELDPTRLYYTEVFNKWTGQLESTTVRVDSRWSGPLAGLGYLKFFAVDDNGETLEDYAYIRQTHDIRLLDVGNWRLITSAGTNASSPASPSSRKREEDPLSLDNNGEIHARALTGWSWINRVSRMNERHFDNMEPLLSAEEVAGPAAEGSRFPEILRVRSIPGRVGLDSMGQPIFRASRLSALGEEISHIRAVRILPGRQLGEKLIRLLRSDAKPLANTIRWAVGRQTFMMFGGAGNAAKAGPELVKALPEIGEIGTIGAEKVAQNMGELAEEAIATAMEDVAFGAAEAGVEAAVGTVAEVGGAVGAAFAEGGMSIAGVAAGAMFALTIPLMIGLDFLGDDWCKRPDRYTKMWDAEAANFSQPMSPCRPKVKQKHPIEPNPKLREKRSQVQCPSERVVPDGYVLTNIKKLPCPVWLPKECTIDWFHEHVNGLPTEVRNPSYCSGATSGDLSGHARAKQRGCLPDFKHGSCWKDFIETEKNAKKEANEKMDKISRKVQLEDAKKQAEHMKEEEEELKQEKFRLGYSYVYNAY